MDYLDNKKKIFIVIAIVTIFFATIIVIQILTKNNNNKIENKLKKEKYTKITEKIYSKDIETDESKTNYVYNIKNKEIIKTITNNDNNQSIMLTYNNKQIKISYMSKGTCNLYQKGIYNEKNYKCDIIENNNNCKPKCDIMLNEAKKFMKEIKNTIY